MHKIREKSDILIIKKYTASKIGTISMLIAIIISTILYIAVLFLLQSKVTGAGDSAILSIFRDVLLAIISILGTSLLTSIFIEKNRKNVDYTELIANDIFASPEFYSNLASSNKQKIFTYLEENMFLNDPIKSEIYRACRAKIYNNVYAYYYNELSLSVSYFVCNGYSEKNIKRVMKIRSYAEKSSAERLYLFSYNLSPTTDGIKNFEVLSARFGIENEPLIVGKDIIIEKDTTSDPFWAKCGYGETYKIYLHRNITLSSDEDLVLSVEYVSRVTDEDNSAGFGVFVPCRKFNFSFIAPQNYIVYAHPHGFLNSEARFPNSLYRNTMAINFDNWLLPGEGVAISVAEENGKISQGNDLTQLNTVS